METGMSRVLKTGDFYEVDGESIRRVVGRPRHYSDLAQLIQELRANACMLLGRDLPEEAGRDEIIRQLVVNSYPHLIHLLPDIPLS